MKDATQLFIVHAHDDADDVLLGANRAASLLINVALPFVMMDFPDSATLAEALPSEDISAPMREMAYRLFGRDHNPAFYARSGLLQQGLLAIYQNFCLTCRGGCEMCMLLKEL